MNDQKWNNKQNINQQMNERTTNKCKPNKKHKMRQKNSMRTAYGSPSTIIKSKNNENHNTSSRLPVAGTKVKN